MVKKIIITVAVVVVAVAGIWLVKSRSGKSVQQPVELTGDVFFSNDDGSEFYVTDDNHVYMIVDEKDKEKVDLKQPIKVWID